MQGSDQAIFTLSLRKYRVFLLGLHLAFSPIGVLA